MSLNWNNWLPHQFSQNNQKPSEVRRLVFLGTATWENAEFNARHLRHKITPFKTTDYNWTSLGKNYNKSYHVWICQSIKCWFKRRLILECFPVGDLLLIDQMVGAYALLLLLHCTITVNTYIQKPVLVVLIIYERQSDIQRSDKRQINVQKIFVYTKTDSYRT